MKLSTLLSPWMRWNQQDVDVQGLQQDSRQVKPGDLFFAYPGPGGDGRLYIEAALARGAVAVLYDPVYDRSVPSGPCFALPHLMQQLGKIASRFYGDPSSALSITGITGTNGKTTVAYQLAQAHALLGKKSIYVGTLGEGEIEQLHPLANTTPGALQLQQLLSTYQQQGAQQVSMEVSSHALSQDRVAAVCFQQAIYTNLTHDHLDYHETMQAYAEAKARLFQQEHLQVAIFNQDDAYAPVMMKGCASTVQQLTYGLQAGAQFKAYDLTFHLKGTDFKLASPWGIQSISLQIPGLFNVYNGLAIVSSLLASGYAMADVEAVMPRLKASPGRMERVHERPMILIDYAHTPDALEKALTTLRHLKEQSNDSGQIWVIFGCGGNRDPHKRPLMGRIASQYADQVVITNDNPRYESPALIMQAILKGILPACTPCCIPDRKEAIRYAMTHMQPEDTLLIAGKGHEAYQDFGTHKEMFSDHAVVRELALSDT